MAHVFCSPQRRAAPQRTREYKEHTQRSEHATNVKGKHCVVQILAAAANLGPCCMQVPLSRKNTMQRKFATSALTRAAHKTLARGWRGGQPQAARTTRTQPSVPAHCARAAWRRTPLHSPSAPTAMFSDRVHQLFCKREGIRHSSKVATKVTHFHIGLVQSMQWLCARRKAAVRALVERVIMRLSLTVIVGAATALAGEAVSQPHAIPWGPLK
jgi:hypothetical protein